MKRLLWVLVIILLLPLISAEISITSELEDNYNLGDSIDAVFSVDSADDIDGLVKVTLDCDELDLDYYTIGINLKEGEAKSVEVSLPKITESMKGDCTIIARLMNFDNSVISDFTSSPFSISADLEIEVIPQKETLQSGEALQIDFSTAKESLDGIQVSVSFGEYDESFALNGKQYTQTIELAKNFKSKDHYVFVHAEDSFGNSFETDFGFFIEQVPTTIEATINQERFKPLDSIEIVPTLLDQSQQLVDDASIEVAIGQILSTSTTSGQKVEYTFDQDISPGEYDISLSSGKITFSKTITIEEVAALGVAVDGDLMHIQNVGNVQYNKKLAITLIGTESQVYTIQETVKLSPGSTTTVDLSKYVRAGEYTIIIEGVIETLAYIGDNRPFYRKISQDTLGIGSSVAVQQAKPSVSKWPLILFLLVVAGLVSGMFLKKKGMLSKVNVKIPKFTLPKFLTGLFPKGKKKVPEGDMKKQVDDLLRSKNIEVSEDEGKEVDNIIQEAQPEDKQEEEKPEESPQEESKAEEEETSEEPSQEETETEEEKPPEETTEEEKSAEAPVEEQEETKAEDTSGPQEEAETEEKPPQDEEQPQSEPEQSGEKPPVNTAGEQTFTNDTQSYQQIQNELPSVGNLNILQAETKEEKYVEEDPELKSVRDFLDEDLDESKN